MAWLKIDDVAGWRRYALCRGVGAELFFPVGELGSAAIQEAEGAKAVCRACPVRESCLEFSLVSNQEFGVWGGLTEAERRPLRRSRRGHVPGPGAPPGPGVALG